MQIYHAQTLAEQISHDNFWFLTKHFGENPQTSREGFYVSKQYMNTSSQGLSQKLSHGPGRKPSFKISRTTVGNLRQPYETTLLARTRLQATLPCYIDCLKYKAPPACRVRDRSTAWRAPPAASNSSRPTKTFCCKFRAPGSGPIFPDSYVL